MRGALASTAQKSVWHPAPDSDADRRERGLALPSETYTRLGKYTCQAQQFDMEALGVSDQLEWVTDHRCDELPGTSE